MPDAIKVASKKDIAPGQAVTVTVNNKQVAVFNVDGKFFAIDGECTHAGGPLCEGEVVGTTVRCPWHGALFDLTNGTALEAPAFDAVTCYKVEVDGDDIKVAA